MGEHPRGHRRATSTRRSPRPRRRSRPGPSDAGEERGKYLQRLHEGLAGPVRGDRPGHRRRGGHAAHVVDHDPGRPAGRQHGRPSSILLGRSSGRRRSATASSSRSRSASSAPSRRGTTRCTRSWQGRRRRSPPAAPSCSSRARSPRSTPSSWPRSSTRSACPPACSTWSRASARSSARPSPPTPTSTWSASPAPPGPASGSAELAAGTVKRVALELGGKSANIILDDADLAEVVPKGVFACYLNSGQTCTAHTRMLVPKEKHDEAVAIAAAAAEGFPVGPADQDGVMLGPLIVRGPARPGPGLHPEGHRRGRRRWPPAAPTPPRAWTPATS